MILLTGATGFLGSYIAEQLVSRNYPVKALVRQGSDRKALSAIKEKIEFLEGDLTDILSLREAVKEADTIIHCAALVSLDKNDKNLLYKINVEATRDLVNIALENKVRNFIYISSVAALGDQLIQYQSDGHQISKDTVSEYARSKYMGELEVWRGYQEGLKVSVLNPSVVIGPGSWQQGSPALFRYVWEKNRYYTEGNFNYVDVRDVATAVCLLLESELSGRGYVLNAGTTTNRNLFEEIARNFRIKAPHLSLNRKFGLFLAYVEKFRALTFRRKPLITKEIIESSFSTNLYNGRPFCSEFKFEYIPLEDSIKWTTENLVRKYDLHNSGR
jgi:dihydroflavonol-4-reductase